MGIRYHKRVNLGKGFGLNVSKSGISSSVRTKFGSFGSKGYSFRSGISGLSYRGGNKGIIAPFFLVIFLLGCALVVAYNLIKIAYYLIVLVFASIFREEGIDYKTLVVVLACVLVILIAIYCIIR